MVSVEAAREILARSPGGDRFAAFTDENVGRLLEDMYGLATVAYIQAVEARDRAAAAKAEAKAAAAEVAAPVAAAAGEGVG